MLVKPVILSSLRVFLSAKTEKLMNEKLMKLAMNM